MSTRTATLSVTEAAGKLGVGINSMYAAVKDGRIPALRVGAKRPRQRIPVWVIARLLSDPALWSKGVAA